MGKELFCQLTQYYTYPLTAFLSLGVGAKTNKKHASMMKNTALRNKWKKRRATKKGMGARIASGYRNHW